MSPVAQLVAVKKVLEFCRLGEVTGSALFHIVGSQLASLFKTTYTLLKVGAVCMQCMLYQPVALVELSGCYCLGTEFNTV